LEQAAIGWPYRLVDRGGGLVDLGLSEINDHFLRQLLAGRQSQHGAQFKVETAFSSYKTYAYSYISHSTPYSWPSFCSI
jgi:hypothetical protein